MNTATSSNPVPTATRDERALNFPFGLLGFESFKHYHLLARPEEAPFLWLRAADHPEIAFVVVSPTAVAPDYAPEISEEDARCLDLRGESDALIFNIVTIRSRELATVNLKGPVIVNRRTLIGKQIITLNAAELPVGQPLTIAA
jgi:flagellar assembly factor FliW